MLPPWQDGVCCSLTFASMGGMYMCLQSLALEVMEQSKHQ